MTSARPPPGITWEKDSINLLQYVRGEPSFSFYRDWGYQNSFNSTPAVRGGMVAATEMQVAAEVPHHPHENQVRRGRMLGSARVAITTRTAKAARG